MTKQTAVFKPAVLPQSLVSETLDTFGGQHGQNKKWRHLADRYFDEGITVAMLESKVVEGKGETNKLYQDVKALAVLSMVPEDQALYSKPKDTLKGAMQKNARRMLDKDVERIVRTLLSYLAKSEAAGEKRPARVPEGLKTKLEKILNAGIKTIQRDDGKHGAPVGELLAAFRTCQAQVNTLFKSK
jgi:hypothetical protein